MFRWIKRLAAPVVALAVFAVLPSASEADVVGIGSAISAPNVAPAVIMPLGFPGGATQVVSGNYTLTNSQNVVTGTGSYNVRVYSPDPTNSNLTTIVFDVTVATGDVNRVTLTNFGTFATDVYVVNGSGQNAQFVDRVSDAGSTLGFTFNQLLPPVAGLQSGESSATFIIRTNAPTYTVGSLNIIDGGIDSVPSFAPAVPLPAPALLGMTLVGGLGGFRGLKAFRRRQAVVA